MNTKALIVLTSAAALSLSTTAWAQQQAPAPVPEQMPADIPYGTPISIEHAKKVADAAVAEATKRGWPMCIAIVGPTGDLVYFEKMDDCQYASVEISQNKAKAAARYRRPTVVFERLIAKGQYFDYLPTLGAGFTGSRGGNPIVAGGKIVGAIGVSGGTGSQDDTISQAGAAALK